MCFAASFARIYLSLAVEMYGEFHTIVPAQHMHGATSGGNKGNLN